MKNYLNTVWYVYSPTFLNLLSKLSQNKVHHNKTDEKRFLKWEILFFQHRGEIGENL